MNGFDEFFNPAPKPGPRTQPEAEKGVQIHGRLVDGVYYVRAADVVALLDANRVLPKIAGRLKAAMKR